MSKDIEEVRAELSVEILLGAYIASFADINQAFETAGTQPELAPSPDDLVMMMDRHLSYLTGVSEEEKNLFVLRLKAQYSLSLLQNKALFKKRASLKEQLDYIKGDRAKDVGDWSPDNSDKERDE